MQFITDYRLEDFILQTGWEDLPADVKECTIRCSIDLCGALLLGSAGKQYETGIRTARRIGAFGEIPVFGAKEKFNLFGAAAALSHAANSFDIDDGYNMVKGHPGASFAGAVLAASLEKDASYGEYLTTLLVCYETAIRWGLAEQDHYGFLHSTGTYGAFGSAAGIGRLHGLTRVQLNNALSIADYHAPLTPVMRAVEYPSMNKDGVPFGTMTGALAVIETEEGESGKTHLLELPRYRAYLDSLWDHFYIRELYFKPYTCCRWAHQPIKACLDLMKAQAFTWEEIKQVTVYTFDAAARLAKAVPADTDEAQYNIAWPVAAALVHGDVGYKQVCDEALLDARVIGMMEKLAFEVDPEMETAFPQRRMAWVKICLKDGRTYQSPAVEAPGEHTDPALNMRWIQDKFRRITAPVLAPEGAGELLDMLSEYSDLPVRSIVRIANQYLYKARAQVN